jgi:hypothetical protein
MVAHRKEDRAVVVPAICERLAKGEPLAVICRDMDIPRRTVNQWRQDDPEIAAQFDEARDDGYDTLAGECLEIADTTQEGVEIVERNGTREVHHGDMLGHRKLRIETRLKLLAKWDPRRYGDKQQLEHQGSIVVQISGDDAKL